MPRDASRVGVGRLKIFPARRVAVPRPSVLLTLRLGERLYGPPDSDGGPTEHRSALFRSGMLRSVDDWPLAKTLLTDFWG